ncbi:hypothetical protein LJC20_02640 [Eubacteriales bacterium OttesenSCG-928-M02]|nr:hypothetical protein [Eubacteriales bacterium OttesenSCG-928-M02]
MRMETTHAMPFVAYGTSFAAQSPSSKDVYEPFFIRGINIGQTLPDTSLANPSIPYDVYAEWFKLIREMNVNTLKVFNMMDADFYRALADHNKTNSTAPLYLMQGIWVNGGDYSNLEHAFDSENWLTVAYKEAVQKTADVLHGQYTAGEEVACQYTADVSAWTVGYIIGSEWDSSFVQATNESLDGLADYSGVYLRTEAAQPFEIFLCEIGEALIAYETVEYNMQRPVAFLNWAPTDTISHMDEPFAADDMVSINTECIRPTDAFQAGLFAAIDVYPYYPEFMNVRRDYIQEDERGNINSFASYLADLKSQYTVPLVVAEFGLSTSRGRAHNSTMGYHQGMLDETQQGEYVLAMMQDIHRLELAGGFIFIWQDEWFKQTWNTVKKSATSARYLNVQSSEQRYGIAAYEPGTDASACYPDGDDGEWREVTPTMITDKLSLSFMQDEAWLYLLVRSTAGMNLEDMPIAVALGTTGGRGNTSSTEYGLVFEQAADFLLILDGAENTRLLTAANSDLFYWMMAYQWGYIAPDKNYEAQDNGIFSAIQMLLSGPMRVPYEDAERPYQAYEAGLLQCGNANPNAQDYASLADYCFGADFIEIRIPWYLLNIFDPASQLRGENFYGESSNGLSLEAITEIYSGLVYIEGNTNHVAMKPWIPKGYEQACYHLRLKKSYWILQQGLAALE